MFCKDRGIDLSVGLFREYAPGTFGDFHFTARHFGDFHFTARWTEKDAFERFNRGGKPNFRCRRDKNIIRPVSHGRVSYATYWTPAFLVTLVKLMRATPSMARFPREYGAYEPNQCKQKTRAHDTSSMIRLYVKRA